MCVSCLFTFLLLHLLASASALRSELQLRGLSIKVIFFVLQMTSNTVYEYEMGVRGKVWSGRTTLRGKRAELFRIQAPWGSGMDFRSGWRETKIDEKRRETTENRRKTTNIT